MMDRSVAYATMRQGAVSRRTLLHTAAEAVGWACGSRFWLPGLAAAQPAGAAPTPIPGGIKLPWGVFIHHYPPPHPAGVWPPGASPRRSPMFTGS
jgi:hypothetical protein